MEKVLLLMNPRYLSRQYCYGQVSFDLRMIVAKVESVNLLKISVRRQVMLLMWKIM